MEARRRGWARAWFVVPVAMALHDPPAPAVAAPFHSPKNLAMALTGEAGELVEPLKYPAARARGIAAKYSKF